MAIFKFGKFKGQEVSEVAKTEQGIGYLRWYMDQPINEKYKEQEDKFRADIKDALTETAEVVAPTSKEPSVTGLILGRLDRIIELLEGKEKPFVPVNETSNDPVDW